MRWDRYGALAIAGFGFVLTRFLVVGTIQLDGSPVTAGVSLLSLVVGLSLCIYGIALALGNFSREYVTSIVRWCAIGVTVVTLVVGMSAISWVAASAGIGMLVELQLLVAKVFLAGAVAGIVIGDRSASNARQRREIRRQANRALFVNRLLRHEVINAVTIVRGHASLLSSREDQDDDSTETIERAVDRIDRTIDTISDIAVERPRSEFRPINIEETLQTTMTDVNAEYPDYTFELRSEGVETDAFADHRLRLAFEELLRNGVEHGDSKRVEVTIETTPDEVSVAFEDDGSELPDAQRKLLESGNFPEYDDPSTGFGLQIVTLLVGQYHGRITVESDDESGTRVVLHLPRQRTDAPVTQTIGVTFPELQRASVAGVVAGLAMGVYFQLGTDVLPIIGALYGLSNSVVGWITHLFHSVFFAILFSAGCVWFAIGTHANRLRSAILTGFGWGILLWIVAAGIVMPIWLRLGGVPAPLPDLSLTGLLSHTIWGIILGGTYAKYPEIVSIANRAVDRIITTG